MSKREWEKGERKIKTCRCCGKEFPIFPYRNLTVKYCSLICARTDKRKKIKRICKNCGKEFLKVPSQFKFYKNAGTCCSQKCVYELMRKRPSNFKSMRYIKYGGIYRAEDREWSGVILKRDNGTCRRCGKSFPKMHTHHIASRARRPDLKHEPSNGICLCSSCHSWVHWHPKEANETGFLSTDKYEKRITHPTL